MEEGLKLIAEQRLPEALVFFQGLIAQDANNAEAHNYLGMVYAFLGEMEAAINSIRQAVALNPNYAEALTNLGVLLAMTDRKEEAIEYYQQALGINRALPEVHNNLGVLLREKGEIEEAVKCFEQALSSYPNYVDALNGLGLCFSNLGKLDDACEYLRRALTLDPDRLETHLNLGLVLREKKELDEALVILQKAIEIDPNSPEAHNHLGLVYRDQKRLLNAEIEFRQAISLNPEYAEAYRNLGVVLYRQSKLENNRQKEEEAISYFEKCLALDPDMPEVHNNLGIVHRDKGNWAKAKESFLKALELRPGYPLACKNLAEVYANEKDYANAIRYYSLAVDQNPKDVDSFVCLAGTLQKEGKLEEAVTVCTKGIEQNPEAIELYKLQASFFLQGNRADKAVELLEKAKEIKPEDRSVRELLGGALIGEGKIQQGRSEWEALLRQPQSNFNLEIKLAFSLPIILESIEQIKSERLRLVNSLRRLTERGAIFNDPLTEIATSNFYLAYHGENDRSIMEEIAQFFLKACPKLEWTAPHCRSVSLPKERIRLGICSKLLRSHTIGRLFGTIVEYLDRSKFEVILIRVPDKKDETAERLIATADRTIELDYNLWQDRETIGNLELDILFYTDIGMEPLTYFLTFSRLAPVQCLTWGHPSTTGSKMMDYFISSRFFEVDNAQDHFTEKLIRFRDPNTCYNRPAIPPDTTREALGLPAEGTLYICPQSLFKIHPEFDPIVANILRGDPNGKAIFLSGLAPTWDILLRERWEKTIPDVLDRIVFIKGLPHEKFLQFLRLGDVMLDPVHFGGGNTSLEAFAMGTPVVTLPGQYTKSRLTLGFYQKMEVTDCIASSPEEYVQIALKLGTDPSYNQQIRHKINERSGVLYDNRDVIREYEKFFTTALTLHRAKK
ncbi:MAG: tetratricopeptide repeat protein [Pseudanabaenaceae cyanobacterium SKYGB_i_bin29]|nr:tetratricopeptide repeat protein [Pseudanabaenaceae cyanobacterium SKYG29]MDW8420805.1 tetratricopeptide repeat protein [Pseudanabaenaceae cyanobacterium SKYGB_i_bin29]